MPYWILIIPIFFPFAAAAAAFLLKRAPERTQDTAALVLVGLEIVLIILNVSPVTHTLILSRWDLASFELALVLDNTAILLLLVIFVVLLAVWLASPPAKPAVGFFIAGSAGLLISAANLMTIYFAWILLDLAIFAWRMQQPGERDSAPRLLAQGIVTAILVFAGALYAGTSAASTGALLVAVAFWARLGIFPFHWILPFRSADDDLWVARGIPFIAGASVWLYWPSLKLDLASDWIGVLAVVALVASAIGALRARDTSSTISMGASLAAVFVPLAVAYGRDAGAVLALWLTLGTALAIALWTLALGWRQANRAVPSWLWVGGMVGLANVPLSPAFVGRVSLYLSWIENIQWGLVLIAGAATGVAVASLWQARLGAEPPKEWPEGRSRQFVALGILCFVYGILGLAPMPITNGLSSDLSNAAASALRALTSTNLIAVVIAWIVLLVPLGIGFIFGRRRVVPIQPLPTEVRTGDVLGLDSIIGLGASVGHEMGVVARNISAIAEENPIVWILLVALWIAIFVLIPR